MTMPATLPLIERSFHRLSIELANMRTTVPRSLINTHGKRRDRFADSNQLLKRNA